MPIPTILLVALGSIAVLATVVPLARADAWWVRGFDFPRLQIGALALLALAGFLVVPVRPAWLRDAFVAALAAAALFQAAKIVRYTPLWRREVQNARANGAERALRIVLANVLQPNRGAERLLEIVRAADPDIFLAVETDEWWAGRLDELAPCLPHRVACPLDNTYGIYFRSRLELVESEVRFLVERDIPSVRARVRLRSGDEIEFHGLHPRPPSPTENDRSTERDAELLVVGRAVCDSDDPVIVAGDLNDVAWSRTTRLFQKVSGLLDPRVGRSLLSTFHAGHRLLRWPLDHVFHSPRFRLLELRRLPRFGSDHFPVLIALRLEPEAEREQEAPEADAEDRAEAHETIAKARSGE